MTTETIKASELIQAHSTTPYGMHFYASLEAVMRDEFVLGYFSAIKRAWREMKLDGVLCLDGRPVLYLKEYVRPFTGQERVSLQRLFWNQGVANVLVLADPISVNIYSGLARPSKENAASLVPENALVECLKLADYVRGIQSLYHSLATGHYYETHQSHFEPGQAVDESLLKNLRVLRDALTLGPDNLDTQKAHAVIGRILFLCYLLDREILSIDPPNGNRTGTARFTEALENQPEEQRIDYLYDIFINLKEKFNGNMFDQNLDAERRWVRPSHLKKLLLFLGGHDVKSGQLSFWPYDFKMIPVETISAIYQDFLAKEDREGQRKRGAFYTPRFLAEMVVDMTISKEPDALDGSFLDPACGSGIFLVILFNRIANRWVIQNNRAHYSKKAKALQEILARQIHGIDLEETACRIACFSLYLAYLDFFDPPDIQEHIEKTGRPLPKLLDYGNELDRPLADISVIYKADFLSDKTLAGQFFDCVIGNPPWEGRGSKQLAQSFMQKAPRVLRHGGVGCLLLPSKILQNQTDAFQAEWLAQVTLDEVLQLADYRFLLFKNALCPAFIAHFRNVSPDSKKHLVEFNAPKFSRDGLRQGIIKVDPSSRAWIPLADILDATRSKTAPVIWKRRLWGTPRDQKLIDMLQCLPSLSILAGEPKDNKRWLKGQGFQPYFQAKANSNLNYPKPKQNPWAAEVAFVPAGQSLEMVLCKHDCISLGERLREIGASQSHLRRAPNVNIFTPPMVLVSQGFSKVVFCDFKVLFQDALQSISGPEEDAELMMFLTVYLRSRLAKYFLFHTSANWGSERDKVHLSELLRVPFPLPGSEFVSHEAGHIVNHVARKFRELRKDLAGRLGEVERKANPDVFFDETEKQTARIWRQERKAIVDGLQDEFEPLIYRYFGLTDQEIALVEDTTGIFIPSATPGTWRSSQSVTLDPMEKARKKPYAEQGLGAYANTLTEALNTWAEAEGSSHRVFAEGGFDGDTGLAMVETHLSQKESPYKEKLASKDLFKMLTIYHKSISNKRGVMQYDRDIFLFQDETIFIIRPNILLNWTRTAALNDAARIYGEIAMARRNS
ncbi:MAG: N-6 DNA methylase [Proteobacteria bacterium]|nr:N-6 DNA methylase [Pseudomonadota bacterium]MBU4470882.1 N-6 DNA methylase [Pseudomonadota bacterium]MCG2751880.1 N-6 DNA methylase [Desulfobacteraceae bacterium]